MVAAASGTSGRVANLWLIPNRLGFDTSAGGFAVFD
jgi:hypothetical protein